MGLPKTINIYISVQVSFAAWQVWVSKFGVKLSFQSFGDLGARGKCCGSIQSQVCLALLCNLGQILYISET